MTHRFAALLLSVVVAAACARTAPPAPPSPEAEADVPIVVPDLTQTPTPAEFDVVPDLATLTLRDKAAQLIMPWIPGDYWADDDSAMAATLRLAAEAHVGGFVVGLGGSAYDLAAKFNALQRAAPLPLLIAADLESGPAMRIRGGAAFPGNMALGAAGREDDAEAVGRVIAREGRAVGIQMVFAPVVDVNNNPANPIINVRSYGEDPGMVGRMGAAFIRGLRHGGMLATAKHFPGHGDTGTDSHIALPVSSAARGRLDSVELVPFRAAVASGVDAVMSAHIAMEGLTGSDTPATLSAAVLDTLLRGRLAFHGLIVTDALNMGAIVSRYGASQAVVMALEAGADILLMPADPAAAIDALVEAVHRGDVREERIDSSVARILAAKARVGLFRRRTVDLAAIPRSVGSAAHETLARDVTARTLVLVKDSLAQVPLGLEQRLRVLVVACGDEGDTRVGVQLAAALRAGGAARVQMLRLFPASGPASYDSVRAAVPGASAVVVAVAARPMAWRPSAVNMPDSLAALVQQLSRAGVPLVTVAFGSPYLLNQVPGTPAYLVAWSDNDDAERAAADAMLGRIGISGKLPVALPPGFPLGSGLMRVPVR